MINPSISIGVVSYPEDGRTSDELMITADNSMYHSKRAGKNRVTGVPVMDQTVVGVPGAEAHVEAPPVAKRKPRAAPAEPADAAREPADNSV
jgi:predicted signal transduction protein with EAL and GGDEF domain